MARKLMAAFLQSPAFHTASTILIGSVWMVFGGYCKVLHRVPRHRRIVERILGARFGWVTTWIGLGEMMFGVWVFSEWQRVACALMLTITIVFMNALELRLARDLLISPKGMVVLNALLMALMWHWALWNPAGA